MTQTIDHADTGEIPMPDPLRNTEILDIGAQHTAVLQLPDETAVLHAPWSPIRHESDETAVLRIPQTIAIVEPFDPGGYPPAPKPTQPGKTLAGFIPIGRPPEPTPPPPPPPAPDDTFVLGGRPQWARHESAEHPLLRRSVPYVLPVSHRRRGVLYRGKHAERPYRWLIGVGALLAASAALTLVVLAVWW